MPTPQRSKRRHHFSDLAVQGTLLLHVVGHWLLFLVTAVVFLLFIEMISGDPRQVWSNLARRHGPTALAMVVLGPIFLRDLVKLSNRFTGPVVRLRRAMHELATRRRNWCNRECWESMLDET